MKRIVDSKKAPAPIGPYSQAIEINGLLFVSGQIAINPETGEVSAADISGQTAQVLENVIQILKEAGYTLGDVVKTTCFLRNLDNFADFNQVYGQYFSENEPARSVVEVSKLPKGSLLKVEVIAAK